MAAPGHLDAKRRKALQVTGGSLLLACAGRLAHAGDAVSPAASPAESPAKPAAAPRRPRVMPPGLRVEPADATVDPGTQLEFLAYPSGGEAMLFSVDWSLREGDAAGRLRPQAGRREDGGMAVLYLAPAAGTGPFHLTASLHEVPSVQVEGVVRLRARP